MLTEFAGEPRPVSTASLASEPRLGSTTSILANSSAAGTAGPLRPLPAERGRAFMTVIGLYGCLVGLIGIGGSHSGLAALVHIHPSLTPMHYTTALGFIALGIAALAVVCGGHPRWVAAIGVALSTLAALAGAVWFLGPDFRIDEALFRDYPAAGEPTGRMAPITALCFALCGLDLAAHHRTTSGWLVFRFLCVGLVWALGTAAVLLLVLDAQPTAASAGLADMPVLTATSFVLLGSALLSWESTSLAERMGTVLPVSVALSGTTLSLVLWSGLVSQDHAALLRLLNAQAFSIRDEIELAVRTNAQAVQRMAERWQLTGGMPRNESRSDARAHLRDLIGLQRLKWVDAAGTTRWIVARCRAGVRWCIRTIGPCSSVNSSGTWQQASASISNIGCATETASIDGSALAARPVGMR